MKYYLRPMKKASVSFATVPAAYISIYTYVHIYIYVYMYINKYINIFICTNESICIYYVRPMKTARVSYAYICTHTHTHTHIYLHI